MINNIDVHSIQNLQPRPAGKKDRDGHASDVSSPDASISVEYGNLIAEASQLQRADQHTVERAQELISSGQLDTPENIRAAALHLTQFGI